MEVAVGKQVLPADLLPLVEQVDQVVGKVVMEVIYQGKVLVVMVRPTAVVVVVLAVVVVRVQALVMLV